MLLFLAPIGLQRIVNEMTLHPRPASLRRTVAVETDHPRILFSLNAPLLKPNYSISILRRIPGAIRPHTPPACTRERRHRIADGEKRRASRTAKNRARTMNIGCKTRGTRDEE